MPATPLQQILAKYRATSQTEREKGSYFEELIRTYFRYEASYADVWLLVDWGWKIDVGFQSAVRGKPKRLGLLSGLVATIQSC